VFRQVYLPQSIRFRFVNGLFLTAFASNQRVPRDQDKGFERIGGKKRVALDSAPLA
jgi:hypothetical protein